MTHDRTGKFTILLMLALWSGTALAELTATVDRTRVTELDVVTLTVRLSGATTSQSPDFSGVEADFDVVAQSGPNRSSRFSFENGRQTSESHTEWTLSLRPKRRGSLTVPAIRLGGERTNPIAIDVVEPSAALTGRMNQLVFFDTSVDTTSTWVQAQIIYTVKLYYVDSIAGDFPQPPSLSEAVIETVENEKRYESIVNDRRFYVLEKSYAIYPQKSGTLVIPRETFAGSRSRSFFSPGERVAAVSKSHTIEVKPRPAAFTGTHWLPAKSLVLTESWGQDKPQFKVGEPVNRVLTMTAKGVASSLLPPFPRLNLANAKTYQDPPDTTDVPNGKDGIVSTQSTTVGIVPTAAGKLALPEIRIPWWNTGTNKMEVAVIPAATFDVAPAPGANVAVPGAPAQAAQGRPAGTPLAPAPVSNVWLYVALTAGLLWLVTLWQWWLARRQLAGLMQSPEPEGAVPQGPGEPERFDSLAKACKANDADRAAAALFLWGKSHYPHIDSLTGLARQSGHADLAEEITTLDRVLYAGDSQQEWNGDRLLAIVRELRGRHDDKPGHSALLHALNPT